MTDGTAQLLIYCLVLAGVTPVLGAYMYRVYAGLPTPLSPVLAPLERLTYRLMGVNPGVGQHWKRYALSAIVVSFTALLFFYAILRLQHVLPLNPRGVGPFDPALAFNAAAAFVTNTDWQAFSPEKQMSYFSQMAGATMLNFLSSAVVMAVVIAVIRGFTGTQSKTVGNFYVDFTRSIYYILLPVAFVASLILVAQGVPQNLSDYVTANTVEGANQLIAQGPVASQTAISTFGTNGGGFFNANSGHPYANPTPLTNFLQMVLILAIPAATTYTFGKMAGDVRQGWALFGAMAVMFVAGLAVVYWSELQGNPLLVDLPLSQTGNMEGKEVRFGIANSALFSMVTTASSAGAVNAAHDSFNALSGLILLFNIHIGEIIFGGVGTGFMAMLLYVVLAVFIAGLMVGRSPEYLGKKIEAKEIKLSVLALLLLTTGMLGIPALTVALPALAASIHEAGPHGLSEVLYAYGSATANNGSSFAGFDSATPFHLTAMGLCMLIGRFGVIIPALAIAGALGAKKTIPPSASTFPTHTPLFVGVLIGVILIVGGLTIFPALALGPLAEHFEMLAGKSF